MKNIKRVFINVHGYVQGVGYRYYVEENAHKYGVKGYVQNMPEGNVYIDVEGDEGSLNKFVDEIKNSHLPIKVDSISVDYSEKPVGYTDFQIKVGDLSEEFVRGFQTGYIYIRQIGNEVGLLREETRRNFELMAKRYDQISLELIKTREELTKAINKMSELIEILIEGKKKENNM